MTRTSPIEDPVTSALAGASGCATKGYVNTKTSEGISEVERQVVRVERALEDTAVCAGRNAARIREVGPDGDRRGRPATPTGPRSVSTPPLLRRRP